MWHLSLRPHSTAFARNKRDEKPIVPIGTLAVFPMRCMAIFFGRRTKRSQDEEYPWSRRIFFYGRSNSTRSALFSLRGLVFYARAARAAFDRQRRDGQVASHRQAHAQRARRGAICSWP